MYNDYSGVGFIIMNVVGREQVKLNVENEYPV
jgi:hypothetical protein